MKCKFYELLNTGIYDNNSTLLIHHEIFIKMILGNHQEKWYINMLQKKGAMQTRLHGINIKHDTIHVSFFLLLLYTFAEAIMNLLIF